MFADDFGGGAKLFIDGGAVGSDVVESPEVEAANLVGLELFGEGDGAGEDFVLLFVGDFGGSMHVTLGAVLRFRSAGPVDFEEWAGDVGDLEFVFGEDLEGFRDFGVGDGLKVLAEHLSQFDVVKAEVVGDDRAGVIEVLRDFVGDDGDFEGRSCGPCAHR